MECARTSASPAIELGKHLESCEDCAAYYRAQLALTPALRALPSIDPQPGLDVRITAAIDQPRWIEPRWRIRAAVALAATLAIGLAIIPRRPAPTPAERQFIAIPYVAPLAPYERAEVRRMDVPVDALIAVGFEIPRDATGPSIPADVLLGQDGRIHAIRFDRN